MMEEPVTPRPGLSFSFVPYPHLYKIFFWSKRIDYSGDQPVTAPINLTVSGGRDNEHCQLRMCELSKEKIGLEQDGINKATMARRTTVTSTIIDHHEIPFTQSCDCHFNASHNAGGRGRLQLDPHDHTHLIRALDLRDRVISGRLK